MTNSNASTIPHWDLSSKPLSTDSMIGLYNAADCYVLCSHGEGWGLPYFEAMSMQLPVIATEWGGNLEFMNKNNSLLVRVQGFEDSDPYDDWLRSFHWATPDVNHLAERMMWVYYNKQESKELGRKARRDVIEKFSNEVVGDMILKRMEEIKKNILSISEKESINDDNDDTSDTIDTDRSDSHPRNSMMITINHRQGDTARGHPRPLSLAFQWTIAADVKLCASMVPASVPVPVSSAADNDDDDDASLCQGQNKVKKIAFVTPFHPRHDGLAYGASTLRQSILDQYNHRYNTSTAGNGTHAAQLQIDVFAIVLDFFSAYSEPYNSSVVKHVIFRESWVDYLATANLINRKYDAVMMNMKLGALGGTSSSYAACFIKLVSKPVILMVHTIHPNMNDEYQFNLLMSVTEASVVIVQNTRERLQLDTALGYLPPTPHRANQRCVPQRGRPENVLVVPTHGGSNPVYSSSSLSSVHRYKRWAKQKLGIPLHKCVMVTAGLISPDKGAHFVVKALEKLHHGQRDDLVYIVAGRVADCGADCIEYYDVLEERVNELGLSQSVVLMRNMLTGEGWHDVWAAADVAAMLYPEDLIPAPSTLMDALSHGAVPMATPFASALASLNERNALLVWERDPGSIIAAVMHLIMMHNDGSLLEMQKEAWKAAGYLSMSNNVRNDQRFYQENNHDGGSYGGGGGSDSGGDESVSGDEHSGMLWREIGKNFIDQVFVKRMQFFDE